METQSFGADGKDIRLSIGAFSAFDNAWCDFQFSVAHK